MIMAWFALCIGAVWYSLYKFFTFVGSEIIRRIAARRDFKRAVRDEIDYICDKIQFREEP